MCFYFSGEIPQFIHFSTKKCGKVPETAHSESEREAGMPGQAIRAAGPTANARFGWSVVQRIMIVPGNGHGARVYPFSYNPVGMGHRPIRERPMRFRSVSSKIVTALSRNLGGGVSDPPLQVVSEIGQLCFHHREKRAYRSTLLGQHRIMGQGDSARDFDPSESMKNAGILDVFPIFHTARLGQKIR